MNITYTNENIYLLLELHLTIKQLLGDDDEHASVTLITKIMLGVFGNIPALDDNFCKGFKEFGVRKFWSASLLRRLSRYYQENKDEIDKHKIKTLDFHTGQDTSRYYTKAKIIDMVGFIEGINMA